MTEFSRLLSQAGFRSGEPQMARTETAGSCAINRRFLALKPQISATLGPVPYSVERQIRPRVLEALVDTPAVAVLGARAVGKSTLTREIVGTDHPATVVDLDDKTLRDAAAADPTGFLAGYEGRLLIDEIQRVPDLLLEIKESIFRNEEPGRFLLTGSANVLTAPRIKDALTGRAEYLTLWPFSQAELAGVSSNFVDVLFDSGPPAIAGAPIGRAAFVDAVSRGGYPAARGRAQRRRWEWFDSYVTSLIERDLRDIADIHKIEYVPRLLRLIATQAASLFRAQGIATRLGLRHETVASYTQLLETLFIVSRVRAWRPGLGNREVHTPKVYIVDSGLMAYLLAADETRVGADDQVTGKILENFIAMEVARLVDYAETLATQYHYRQGDDEIDIVLETHSGLLAALEVKAGATVTPSDYRLLEKLRNARSEKFVAGIVFYTGPDTKTLSDRIWAVPISGLWAQN